RVPGRIGDRAEAVQSRAKEIEARLAQPGAGLELASSAVTPSSSVLGWRTVCTTKPRLHSSHNRIMPGAAMTTVNSQKPTHPSVSATYPPGAASQVRPTAAKEDKSANCVAV